MIEQRRVRDLPRLEREKLQKAAFVLGTRGYSPAAIARKLEIASVDVRRWLDEAEREAEAQRKRDSDD